MSPQKPTHNKHNSTESGATAHCQLSTHNNQVAASASNLFFFSFFFRAAVVLIRFGHCYYSRLPARDDRISDDKHLMKEMSSSQYHGALPCYTRENPDKICLPLDSTETLIANDDPRGLILSRFVALHHRCRFSVCPPSSPSPPGLPWRNPSASHYLMKHTHYSQTCSEYSLLRNALSSLTLHRSIPVPSYVRTIQEMATLTLVSGVHGLICASSTSAVAGECTLS